MYLNRRVYYPKIVFICMTDYTYLSNQNIKDIQKVLHAKTIIHQNENSLKPDSISFNLNKNTECTIKLNKNGLVSIEIIIDEDINLNDNINSMSFKDVHPYCSKFISDFEQFLKAYDLTYPYSVWKYPVLFTDNSPPYHITTIFPLLSFEQDTKDIEITIYNTNITVEVPKHIVENEDVNKYIKNDWFNTLTNKDKVELFNLNKLNDENYSIKNC